MFLLKKKKTKIAKKIRVDCNQIGLIKTTDKRVAIAKESVPPQKVVPETKRNEVDNDTNIRIEFRGL